MKILHAVPGLDEQWNGIAVAAKLLVREQGALCVEIKKVSQRDIQDADEVWVHSCWTPCVWRVCSLAIRAHKRLVRMLHGNLDPVRLRYHGWKKWLVGPIERHFLRKASKIVVTCEAEKGWIEAYLGKRCPAVEVTDIKRFFDLSRVEHVERVGGEDVKVKVKVKGEGEGEGEGVGRVEQADGVEGELHLLYLGRRHPLKGLEYLEAAVRQIQQRDNSASLRLCVKIVSNVFGEEKEKVWEWCDVLVLPTLSENFGLVVAEALERGKRVITTDGAPAWGSECKMESVKCKVGGGEIWSGYYGRLIYLKGYRDGTGETRVALLKEAIEIMKERGLGRG